MAKAYSIKRKTNTGFPKKDWGIIDVLRNRINHLIYEEKRDGGLELTKPKLLTIIIRKDKEHFFHFLRDETEFAVKGKWQDVKHKPYHLLEEDNVEIQVQYLDNEKDTITKKLDRLFKAYNKEFVREDVLYVTSTPLDKTSLNLKEGRV
jgi:hypothetical protein